MYRLLVLQDFEYTPSLNRTVEVETFITSVVLPSCDFSCSSLSFNIKSLVRLTEDFIAKALEGFKEEHKEYAECYFFAYEVSAVDRLLHVSFECTFVDDVVYNKCYTYRIVDTEFAKLEWYLITKVNGDTVHRVFETKYAFKETMHHVFSSAPNETIMLVAHKGLTLYSGFDFARRATDSLKDILDIFV